MKPLQAVILRLFSALALVAGIVMLGLAIPIAQVETAWGRTLEQLPANWQLIGFLIGGLLIVFGLFGLLPLGIRRGKSVAFASEHGQIIIQLDPVERKLNKVLNKMPEVKKIRAVVVPDKEGGPAHIRARAWLRRLPEQRARDIELRVADYIEETATDFLGLEARTPVELVVEDIEINIDEAAKELQRHSHERAEEKELSQAFTPKRPDETEALNLGQAAAAAALAHEAITAEAEAGRAATSDDADYVGAPATLDLDDDGVYSPEHTDPATSEYTIGTSAGEVKSETESVDAEDVAAGAFTPSEPGRARDAFSMGGVEEEKDEDRSATFTAFDSDTDDYPPQTPEDDNVPPPAPFAPASETAPEPPEQDAVQTEYTLTTPGEPEDELPAAPTSSVPLYEEADGDLPEDSRSPQGPEAPYLDDPLADDPDDQGAPLPPLEEIGPEEETPYDYGMTTESDEEDDLEGLPPLGELRSQEEDETEEKEDKGEERWRF